MPMYRKVKTVSGSIAEVGCNEGRTTLFLNKYMDAQGKEKKYFAIDTFSGFTAEDVAFEAVNRQKDSSLYEGCFRTSKAKFDKIMARNNVGRVVSIEADVNKYDLTSLGDLCFVLLDVDLYRPIKKSLAELYKVLSPGRLMVVDDCDDHVVAWDGANQAYRELMAEINQPVEIVFGKLGIVRK